jgi:regulator of RNase E activity RraA
MSNIGFRVRTKFNRPDRSLVDAFADVPVANIADNMNRMSCISAKIRPLNTASLLGTAFTVKVNPGDNLMLHKAIDMAEPGDVIVVDAQGSLDNAITGELMVAWMAYRKVAGLIIDGAIRDVGTIQKMNFPVYAAGATPKGPYKNGPGESNNPPAKPGAFDCEPLKAAI